MDASSSIPWLIVNLLFAVLALGIGFVAGAILLGGKKLAAKSAGTEPHEETLQKRIAVERALLATGQLQDLATGVATHVSEHSQCVKQIAKNLHDAKGADGVVDQTTVSAALTQIADANEYLQKRLEKAEQQIKAQAMEIATHESEARTDSLTDLSNRRAFDDEMSRRVAEWQRKRSPFSLVILDVDHFKKFNDTHGHPAGDEVLRRVAQSMRESTREMDIPCRYGGEEFAVILPTTTLKDAALSAERVRKGIEALRIEFEGKVLSVTASLGVAEVQGADDAKLILRRADEALYASKDAGRNNGHVSTQGEHLPIEDFLKNGKPAAPAAAAPKTAPKTEERFLDALPNRTLFANLLHQRVSESHRTHAPLSVMMVQVEGCDRLSEKYGESVATLTVECVAKFLHGTLRGMDLLARVAGDRFAVMLPGVDEEFAQKVARRAEAALAGCVVPLGGEQLRLEASITFSTMQEMDTAKVLMERTEAALKAPSSTT